jgi:hypothetical protein
MIARLIRHGWPIVLMGLCLVAMPLAAQTQTPRPTPTPTQAPVMPPVAHAAAVGRMHSVARDFAKVTSQFDAAMKAALADDTLRTSWEGIIAQLGAFKSRGAGQEQPRGAYVAVTVQCEFERAKVDVIVVFSASGQIAGLQMRPPASATPYAAPAYVVSTAFKEREVTVGAGEWARPWDRDDADRRRTISSGWCWCMDRVRTIVTNRSGRTRHSRTWRWAWRRAAWRCFVTTNARRCIRPSSPI